MSEEIKGSQIERAYTLNSMYANNQIELQDNDGNIFRIHVDEIVKVLKRRTFTVTKKRKYNHLTLKTKQP